MPGIHDIRIITSEPQTFKHHLKSLWKHRSFIWLFARRDLKVKYAQTWLGLGWTVLQPLTGMAIFTFFFSYLLKWEADGMHYAIYVLSGLAGWNFFSFIVSAGSQSILEASNIIKKFYVPKAIFPASKVLYGLFELAITLVLLLVLSVLLGAKLSFNLIFFPLVIFYNAVCGLLLVFWTSALAYKKQDIFHVLPFILYFGIWLTPVFFTEAFLPESFRPLLSINPMENVVSAWRWSVFGLGEFRWIWVGNFLLVTAFMLAGLYLFLKREDEFSDYV